MKYRRFGRTELQMPVISCGGMRYQFFRRDLPHWLLPASRQKHVDNIVDAALQNGINHFETARDYGTSEKQLGASLRRYSRDRYLVQTKVFPCSDVGKFRQTLERSLDNLDIGSVDLFAIHGINNRELADYAMRDGGCWDVARQYQAEGKIKHIGFSTHANLELITELVETDKFDFLNVHWYYINQINWPAIEAAASKDMGVFIISPSDKGGMLYRPSQKLVHLCAPLSPMVFNDLFCLNRPEVHTLSVGAARPSDFDEHLKVLPLLDDNLLDLEQIIECLADAAAAALGKEWLISWDINLPSPEDTPGNINVRTILWLRNLLLAYDMQEYATMRYNLLGNGGHWFPGNNAAQVDDLNLTASLAASPHSTEIPALLKDTHKRLVGKQRKRLSRGWFVRG